MWPLDRRCDVVRIGRKRVERWERTRGGLAVARDVELLAEVAPTLAALERSLGEVLGVASRPIDVVIESAWLPVMAIRTGPAFWARGGVEALARHRMAEVHDDRGAATRNPDGSATTWEYFVDHRPGDDVAVAYGLPGQVRATVERAAAGARVRVHSLQPALAWGRHELGSKRDGWWVWLEQDRALVCHVARGRVRALNAGAALPTDAASCRRLLAAEGLRQGIAEVPNATVAGWQMPFPNPEDDALFVASVGGDATDRSPAAVEPIGAAA